MPSCRLPLLFANRAQAQTVRACPPFNWSRRTCGTARRHTLRTVLAPSLAIRRSTRCLRQTQFQTLTPASRDNGCRRSLRRRRSALTSALERVSFWVPQLRRCGACASQACARWPLSSRVGRQAAYEAARPCCRNPIMPRNGSWPPAFGPRPAAALVCACGQCCDAARPAVPCTSAGALSTCPCLALAAQL